MADVWEAELEKYRDTDTQRRRDEETQRQTEWSSPLRNQYPSLRAELSDMPKQQEFYFSEQRGDACEDETLERGAGERDEQRERQALQLFEFQDRSQLNRLDTLRTREGRRQDAERVRRLSEERVSDTERRRQEEQSRQGLTYPSLRGELAQEPKVQETFFADQRVDFCSEESGKREMLSREEDTERRVAVLHEQQECGQIMFQRRVSDAAALRREEARPPSPTKRW